PAEIPECPPPHRHAQIGLLDSPQHLLVKGFGERSDCGGRLGGVGVFRFEIRPHLGVLPLPQPGEVVYDLLPAAHDPLRPPQCQRCSTHPTIIPFPRCRIRDAPIPVFPSRLPIKINLHRPCRLHTIRCSAALEGDMTISRRSLPFLLALACSLPLAAQFGRGPAGPQRATTPPPLQFHWMGPATGGRIASAAGVPGDPSTYYLGSASGGLWKSTDGGPSFLPIVDNQKAAAICTIAVAPSDASTVWVGTGEPWVIRPADIIGDGVYRSADAGKTWQNMGLVASGRIARIVINPRDANNILVCAEGRLTSPQQERGVFRSTDGGANWTKTLFVNAETGCSGHSMDPNDPNTVFAGTWQVSQRTWDEASGGPGSGVYASHDNGQTWTHLTAGLPHSPLGKIDVGIAPSNPQRVYALIQTYDQGSLW